MTKIRDVKSKIEDLEIIIDEVISIQVLNFFDLSFVQFLNILSYKAREKEKLPTLENLAKLLENKKLQIKNQDKVTANYAKRFLKKKSKLLTRTKNSKNPNTNLLSKCQFCEKKHEPNEYWHLQAECYYCHEIGQIAKFYKKKIFSQANPK